MGLRKRNEKKDNGYLCQMFNCKAKENLERQKDRLRKHAENKGYKFILIDEIASGINEKERDYTS